MTDIPDGDSLEEQLKWRRFADRIDQLFKPDRRKRAELAKACVLSSCYRPVWREFSFRKSGRF